MSKPVATTCTGAGDRAKGRINVQHTDPRPGESMTAFVRRMHTGRCDCPHSLVRCRYATEFAEKSSEYAPDIGRGSDDA